MACDLCGKVGEPLVSLLPTNQTSEIKDICSTCEAKVNKMHGKLLSLTLSLMTNAFKDWLTVIQARKTATSATTEVKD